MVKSNIAKGAEKAVSSIVAEMKKDEMDKYKVLAANVGKIVALPLRDIQIEDNVRHSLDRKSAKFQQLVESIRNDGLLQNIVVEVRFDGQMHQLYCIAGQRRTLAAMEAGLSSGPCLIQSYERPADRISSGLTENLVREDLHLADIALGYAELLAAGWSKEQIAEKFERGLRTIDKYLEVATWPPEMLELIRKYPDIFTTRVIFNELTVRSLNNAEDLRKAIYERIEGTQALKSKIVLPEVLQTMQKQLRARYKTQVAVKGTEFKGKIIFGFKTAEEREQLVELLLR
jgi:ParB/RepB/Spo0J family partition protein